MSTIKQALSRLKNSVQRLEISMNNLEYSMAGQQRDMFAAPGGGKGAAKPFHIDSALISQRLDKAIKKVEELLES